MTPRTWDALSLVQLPVPRVLNFDCKPRTHRALACSTTTSNRSIAPSWAQHVFSTFVCYPHDPAYDNLRLAPSLWYENCNKHPYALKINIVTNKAVSHQHCNLLEIFTISKIRNCKNVTPDWCHYRILYWSLLKPVTLNTCSWNSTLTRHPSLTYGNRFITKIKKNININIMYKKLNQLYYIVVVTANCRKY